MAFHGQIPRLSRRQALTFGLGLTALPLAAACGGAPASPTAAPAKPAEPAKPAAPAAPAATTAPAPAAPAATTAPAPAAPAATAAPAPAAKPGDAAAPGKQLIGKQEGPELITDPAQFPKQFNEAPMLAEQVKAGKLPPVAERPERMPRSA